MRRLRHRPAFTLIELIVSMTVVSLLIVFLFQAIEGTNRVWRFSTAKVESFRAARDAFEGMTRRLSQATLNTYWDYEFTGSGATQVPSRYVRQSDLRFVSGSAQVLTGDSTVLRPGHAVLFQAPLGEVDDTNFEGLGNLLNTCGYFIEFNSDAAERPAFLNSLVPKLPERHRFRLMELRQPSNRFGLYKRTSALAYQGREWIKDIVSPASGAPPPKRMLAENVIALVLLPKLAVSEDATGTRLAPAYEYDSTATKADPLVNPKNQLPPLVQVTLVAIDETTALRVANAATPPDFGLGQLFVVGKPKSAESYAADLRTLIATLNGRRLNHRVFTTTVSIRAAKWSRD